MSTASTNDSMLKHCGRTQEEFINLLKKHRKMDLYNNYFFKATSEEVIPQQLVKHKATMLKRPDLDRCKRCGCTIDEHLPTTKRDRDVAEGPSKRTKDEFGWEPDLYQCVAAAEEKNGFLEIGGGRSWFCAGEGPSANKILIRQWHKDVWDAYHATMAKNAVIALIGTPGIGKSIGLNYFLHRYLQAAAEEKKNIVHKRYVAVILPNACEYYIFDTQEERSCRVSLSVDGLCACLHPFMKDLFILHDLGTDRPITSRNIPTIIATYPKETKYKEFMKGETGMQSVQMAVPPLTFDEMSKLATVMHFEPVELDDSMCDSWEKAVYFFDNVPRHVFGDSSVAVSQFNHINAQLHALKPVSTPILKEPTCYVDDELFMYKPIGSGYTKGAIISFKKGYVTDKVAEFVFQWWVKEWRKLMCYTPSGNIFEAAVHEFMGAHATALRVQEMTHMPASGAPLKTKIAELARMWPSSSKKAWGVVVINPNQPLPLESGHYCYPREPNFSTPTR